MSQLYDEGITGMEERKGDEETEDIISMLELTWQTRNARIHLWNNVSRAWVSLSRLRGPGTATGLGTLATVAFIPRSERLSLTRSHMRFNGALYPFSRLRSSCWVDH